MRKLFVFLMFCFLYGALSALPYMRVEYFVDTDPGFGKAATAALPVGDSAQFTVDMAALIDGFHVLYVRTQDSAGHWSQTMNRAFYKQSPITLTLPNITYAECFIDTDPGFGKGQSIAIAKAASDVSLEVVANLPSLSIGTHTVYVRALDANGAWSQVQSKEFCYGAVAKFAVSDTIVCNEGFITFTNKTLGASTGTTYAWDYNGDGTVDYTGKNNATRLFSKPGAYTATLKVSEAGDVCPNTVSQTIIVSKPTVAIEATVPRELYIKQTQQLRAQITLASDKRKTKWTSTGGTFVNDTLETVQFSATESGVYTLTATVTDVIGCQGTQSITVRVLPLIENFIVRDTIGVFRSKQNRIATQYLTASNKIEWFSCDESIATVNAAGLVSCVANGATYIWGKVDGQYTDSVLVQVKDYVPLDSIRVIRSAGLTVGTATNSTVYFYPETASIKNVKWYSSDSTIAKVAALDASTAEITPLKNGTCNIIVVAEDGNIPAVTFVTVSGTYVAVQKVVVPSTVYAKVGQDISIKALIEPYYATNDTIEWSSDDATIAEITQRSSVSKAGVVKAKSVGTTYIYSNASEGTGGFTKIVVSSSDVPTLSVPSSVSFYLENTPWTLDVSKYIGDDNTLPANLEVSISSGTALNATFDANKKLSFTSKVTDWTGSEVFTITVTDADKQTTSKQIEVIVSGTPNAAPQLYFPSVLQTAAQAVSFALSQYVSDDRDALSDLQITALAAKGSVVEVSGGVLQITPASASWTGVDTITITATDSKGKRSTQRITYTVKTDQVATAPRIQDIPVQTGNSFGQFETLLLNRYVKDAVTLPANIVWETSVSFKLDLRIVNNVLTATPVDINWVGTERVQLIATNEAGLRDTAEIIFIKQNTQEVVWEGSAQIDFFAERTIAPSNSSIALYPNMTGARSWKWIITGAGDTITSQALYPNILFKKNGVYSVSLVCQTKTNRDTLKAKNYISIFGISPRDTTICAGGTAKLMIDATGLDSWKWSTGETDNIIRVSPSKTQTYKIHLVSGLFEYDDSVHVKINPKVNLGKDFSLCEKSSKEISAPDYKTLYWNGSTQAAATFSATQKGAITVRAVDAGGCESKDTVEVTDVLPLPVTEVGKIASICNGAAALLVSKNGASYLWSNDNKTVTSINDSLTVTVSGKYYVKTTAANGCATTDTITVAVNKRPDVTAEASTTSEICGGDSVSITASGALSYTLSNKATLGNKFALYTIGNNVIKVIGVDANACSDSVEVTVVVKPTPNLLVNSHRADVCAGSSFTLEATGASTITWDHGVVNAQSFVPTVGGKYIATGKNANGCSDTATVYVLINTLPTVTATPSDTVICFHKTLTLSGKGARNYAWSGGASNNVAFAPTASGTYTVTGTDYNGCKATASVKVSVLKPTAEQIGVVTYDSTFGKKVIIAWNRRSSYRTERYALYRDNGAMGWDSIAGTKFNDSALVYDTQANLDIKAYRYKLETIDSVCHNRDSCIHRTMHVTASTQIGGYKIEWNTYKGFNTKSYEVIRINPDKTITTIATQSGDAEFLSVSDLKPVNGAHYRVLYKLPEEVFPKKIKTDTGPFSQSFSNMSEASLVSESELVIEGVSIYPNPAKDEINIMAANAEAAQVFLIAASGTVVTKTTIANSKAQFIVAGLAKGIYTVQLQTNDKAVSEQVVVE